MMMERIMIDPFRGISLKPYRLIAAGGGLRNIVMPDGTVTGCDELKRELEYPQLFAWNAERKLLLERVAYKREHPEDEIDLVVDSGAYSAWSIGKPFDVDEYIDFLNSNGVIDVCFWAAEADVIPGRFGVNPTEKERLEAPEKSWENYLYMIERVRWPKKIVPIFHMGEDFKHLDRMLSFRFEDGDFIPYIGISPRNDVSVPEKVKWYEKTWAFIYERCAQLGRKIPLTHNFGCTSISIMEQYPSCSSDSTSWLRAAGFGKILLPRNGTAKLINVSDKLEFSGDHIKDKSPFIKEDIEKMCAEIGHGLTLEHLAESHAYRQVFNLYSLNKWKQNFVYKGTRDFKEELW